MTSGTVSTPPFSWSVSLPDPGSISALNSGHSHPLCWSISPLLAVKSNPPRFLVNFHLAFLSSPPQHLLLCRARSAPVGSRLPRSSLAPASLGPQGHCPTAAALAPATPAAHPPTPSAGSGSPPSPEQLKVSVTSEGRSGGGEGAGEPEEGDAGKP